MTYSIDEIMDMLDWNQPEEIQSLGRSLAREIRCINVFLQPLHKGHGKNVWDNCALILAQRSDDELCPYLSELFEWLIDINWPGAFCIEERLRQYEDKSLLYFPLITCLKRAIYNNEGSWLSSLLSFCEGIPKNAFGVEWKDNWSIDDMIRKAQQLLSTGESGYEVTKKIRTKIFTSTL